MTYAPLTEQDKVRYSTINQENIDFLMTRNNRINRWVIADMIRRTRYHYPDKTALIFNDISLTYSQLEDQCNQAANALAALGVKKYDRVAILAHNTHHHVLTWLGCCQDRGDLPGRQLPAEGRRYRLLHQPLRKHRLHR